MNILKSILVLSLLFILACNSSKKKPTEVECKQLKGSVSAEAFYPEWSYQATLYEVNVRQYTPEGTFAAFATHLPRLKEMGVDILWFMPIYPISKVNRKGSLGSYYAIQDYKAVNPEFGTLDDFKALVDQAHSMGFKIMLDWVANHTGWDGPWIENHPEWFTHNEAGEIVSPVDDWSDVADLNYDVPEMRAAMIDALKFWITEADIDGYRCDVAGMVPTDFWEEARAELDFIKPVFMLAEDEGETDLLIKAFNFNYGWSFHHLMNQIAQGTASVPEIKTYFAKADSTYPVGSYAMHFTSNHDENSWNGTEYERMGDAVKALAALTFTIPGMPLIYSGQEAGLTKRLAFFEKDEIEWENLKMQKFYQKLIEMKKSNQSLWNGCAGGPIEFIPMEEENSLLVFSRKRNGNKVLAIFNLSDKLVTNTFADDNAEGEYINAMNGKRVHIELDDDIEVDPWEFMILTEE